MRVLVGVSLLYESLISIDWYTASIFLTEYGVNPRSHAVVHGDHRIFSLHLAHGSAVWTAALHLTMVVSACMLLVGWRSRAASAIGYVLFVSTMNRAWMLGHSFDLLLIAMMLWGALGLPWSKAWSVDAALLCAEVVVATDEQEEPVEEADNDDDDDDDDDDENRRHVLSLGTVGMYVQLAVLYFLTAWHKTDVAWSNGTAPLTAMDADFIARPLSRTLRSMPQVGTFFFSSFLV